MKTEGLGQGLGGANYQYEKSGWDEQRDANCIVRLSKEAKKFKKDLFRESKRVYIKYYINTYKINIWELTKELFIIY